MNLNERMMNLIGQTFLNHALIYIGLFCVAWAILEYYNKFLRIDEKTDKIDLMERYVQVRLLRRYNGRQSYL